MCKSDDPVTLGSPARGVLIDRDAAATGPPPTLPRVPEAPAAPPSARLIAGGPALAGCVRAFIERDTVGAALRPEDRFNHFPASPLCAISLTRMASSLAGQSTHRRR